MNPRRALVRLAAVVLSLAAIGSIGLAGASADEQLTHETLREFYRTGKYRMYISGKAQTDARIYHSRRAGAFLVLASDYGKPLLIQPREKTVSVVKEDEVAERPDKGVDLVKDAAITKLGALRLDGGGMAVKVEGLLARLQPQPYLLGSNDAEAVLLHSPEYERGSDAYEPRSGDIAKINKAAKEIEVVVYFGSWCPTCKRLLPRILRVDKEIAGSKVKIIYYGLPKGRAMRNDPNVRSDRISRIPTGVIRVDGKSVGKISSKAWSRPETAIARALGS